MEAILRSRCWGEGTESLLGAPPCQHLSVVSNLEALCTCCSGGFVEVYCVGIKFITGHWWLNSSPSFLSGGWGALWWPAPVLKLSRGCQPSVSSFTRRYYHFRESKGLETMCQEPGTKTKCIYFHSIFLASVDYFTKFFLSFGVMCLFFLVVSIIWLLQVV